MLYKYYVEYPKEVTKREAEKNGCFILEVTNIGTTTKNKALQRTTINSDLKVE